MYQRISALEAVAQTLTKPRPLVSLTYRCNPLVPTAHLFPLSSFYSSSSGPSVFSNSPSSSSTTCSCTNHHHHHSCTTYSVPSRGSRTFSSSGSSSSDNHGSSFTASTVVSSDAVSPSPSSSTPSIPGVTSGGDLMIMLYTCRVCETRSARQISKQGYYHGSVIVRCPGCKNLHLISDHLGWFDDEKSMTAESLLKQRGEAVRNGLIPEGKDAFVIELTEADRKVLLSRTKSVRLTDDQELDVIPAGNEKKTESSSNPSAKK